MNFYLCFVFVFLTLYLITLCWYHRSSIFVLKADLETFTAQFGMGVSWLLLGVLARTMIERI